MHPRPVRRGAPRLIWREGSATTQFANLLLNGYGFISSLEAGYPFAFPWLGLPFVLEPQGQIVWQEVSFQGANNGLGRPR